MSATAFQLRRRQAAAEAISARLGTASLRRRFIAAVPLDCAEASADALRRAILGFADPQALVALAEDIAAPKRRRARRRRTKTQ